MALAQSPSAILTRWTHPERSDIAIDADTPSEQRSSSPAETPFHRVKLVTNIGRAIIL
jgi:hypothetical protein